MTINELMQILTDKNLNGKISIIDNRIMRPVKMLVHMPVILRKMPEGKYIVELRDDWGYVISRNEFSNENDACEEILKHEDYMSEYFSYGTNHR